MSDPLNVLVLEDRPSDAELMVHELRRSGFEPKWKRVETEQEFSRAINEDVDLILADYSLPQYDALRALRDIQRRGLEIPFIVITGAVSEEAVVECMRQGASDYLLKDRLTRLGPAVIHALHQTHLTEGKKEAEIALQKSEALNQAILRSQNAIVAVLDHDGTIIAVNDAWNQFARDNGDPNLENTGKGINYLEVTRRAAENGDEGAKKALLGIKAVLDNSESIFSLEYPAHSKKRKRWFLLYVTPLDQGQGVVVTHLEITQRKLAEEQLSLLSKALESADNTVIITDKTGTIVWVNPAFSRLTGYPGSQAIGHYSHLANAHAHDPETYQAMWNTILSGQVWHGEMMNRRRDGSKYMAEITITPVYSETGEITHFIDIEQDITERKQHESELEAIANIANGMRMAKTHSEMLPMVLNQISELVKADSISIALYDPQSDEMVFILANGALSKMNGVRMSASKGMTGEVMSSRSIYLVKDASNEPRLKTGLFPEPTAVAGVPMIAQGQIVGIIWVARKTEFTLTEAQLLSAIADISANAIYRASLYEETEQRLQRLTATREIDKSITASLDACSTLKVLVDQVITQLAIHAADVLLMNPQTQTLEYATCRGFRNNLTTTALLRGKGYAHQAVLERRLIAIPDVNQGKPGDSKRLHIHGEDFVAYFAVPLIAKGKVKGVLELFHRSPLSPNADWLNFLDTLAGQAAIAIDNADLFSDLQRSNLNLAKAFDDTIEGWARALDLRDRETHDHSKRVTRLSISLARLAGIPESDLVHIRRGALLHDIGKMGIPDEILQKPGPLTSQEWAIMRQHPQIANSLLSPIEFLHPALCIPLYHHEKWDGTGYPDGKKGEEIPLPARIFSIVDVFDAVELDRVYHAGWGRAKALAYIREQAGKHFDPRLVELFLKMIEETEAAPEIVT